MNKLVFILFVISFSQKSMSFTLSNSGRVSFPSSEIKVVVAGNDCSTAGLNSPEELKALVEESMDEFWNRIPTCTLELEVSGVNSSIDTSSDELIDALNKTTPGQILIGCSDSSDHFSSDGTLGVASINTANGDRGAVLLNNRNTAFANLDQREKLATIAHEVGHAFGLGHSTDEAALMYFSVGGKVQEKLSIDDYDACSYLYPHDAPGGCGSVSYVENTPPSSGSGQFKLVFSLLMGLLISLGLKKSIFKN